MQIRISTIWLTGSLITVLLQPVFLPLPECRRAIILTHESFSGLWRLDTPLAMFQQLLHFENWKAGTSTSTGNIFVCLLAHPRPPRSSPPPLTRATSCIIRLGCVKREKKNEKDEDEVETDPFGILQWSLLVFFGEIEEPICRGIGRGCKQTGRGGGSWWWRWGLPREMVGLTTDTWSLLIRSMDAHVTYTWRAHKTALYSCVYLYRVFS